MRRNLLLILFLLFAPPRASAGEPYLHVSVDAVARFLGTPGVHVFDVNPDEIWSRHHLPGAVHVTDPDLSKVLPADRGASIVFYCSGRDCEMSHAAAREAAERGYTNVFVMVDGIEGWVARGKPVERAPGAVAAPPTARTAPR